MSETAVAQGDDLTETETETETEGETEALPSVTFASLDKISFKRAGDALFQIELDGLPFAFRLRRKRKSGKLLVVLNGAAYRAPPSFGPFHTYARLTKVNVMAISDPTLVVAPHIRISCFLGERDRDPITGLIRLTEAVAKALGVPPDGVIYAGHSGGGFGALMAAIRSNGCGLAVNPQLDLGEVPRTPVAARVATVFEHGKTIPALRAEHPTRASVLEALKEAHANGARPRLAIAQNTEDNVHHLMQFEPFRRRLAEDKALADTSGIWMTTFEHSAGHKPPKGMMRQLVSAAFAHFGAPGAMTRARRALAPAEQDKAA